MLVNTSARHSSLNTGYSRYSLKSKSLGAAQRDMDLVCGNKRGAPGRGAPGFFHIQHWELESALTLSFCLSSPSSCSSPSPAATVFCLHCSLKPMCSQAQHTRSQPATSSEAAVRNYSQLLRAAGWPALQTRILIP